jgi:hypothetical protein
MLWINDDNKRGSLFASIYYLEHLQFGFFSYTYEHESDVCSPTMRTKVLNKGLRLQYGSWHSSFYCLETAMCPGLRLLRPHLSIGSIHYQGLRLDCNCYHDDGFLITVNLEDGCVPKLIKCPLMSLNYLYVPKLIIQRN